MSRRSFLISISVVDAASSLVSTKPAGSVCHDGKCVNVRFSNVPCFVFGLDLPLEVPGIGTLTVDVAYGGMIYVLVNAAALGFSIVPDEAADMVDMGEAIKAGVTRNKQAGQGNGLAGTLSIATGSGGSFSIISGRGRLNVFHDPKTSHLAARSLSNSRLFGCLKSSARHFLE